MSKRRLAPWPLIEIAIEPKSKADQEKLGVALQKLAAEDPTFRVSADQESGQTVLGGTGELHLDAKVDILVRTYKVEANIGAPQVAYRETLGRAATVDFTHKQIDHDDRGVVSGQFARVKIVFEPTEPGSGYQFETVAHPGMFRRKHVRGAAKGLRRAKQHGLLAGFPVVDFKATLIDGAYHDLDSSALAFEIAARAAFLELREKASPKLLEPIMKVEVTAPEDWVGDVIGDLNLRRAEIEGAEQSGNDQIVSALVPLANMFGYASVLRSVTEGQAKFRMDYDHYQAVPQEPGLDDDPRFPPAAARRAGSGQAAAR